MCGRFVSTFSLDELVNAVSEFMSGSQIVHNIDSLKTDYNVAPTRDLPVIRFENDLALIDMDRWGLVPSWSKEPGIGSKMINARCETVTEKPSFRNLLRGHRCLVPLSGFYEWTNDPILGKTPHYISSPSTPILFAAGLWTQSPILGDVQTFTMITRDAFASTHWLHHRSPSLMTPEQCHMWLVEPDTPLDLLASSKDFDLEVRRVSKRVNSVRNNDADLISETTNDELF